jgi:hypothetical protein
MLITIAGRRKAMNLALLWICVAIMSLAQEAPTSPRNFRVSLSVSPFAEQMFRAGMVFTDGKMTAQTTYELQKMFNVHGANEAAWRLSLIVCVPRFAERG